MNESDPLEADDVVFVDDETVGDAGAAQAPAPDDPWAQEVFVQLDKLENSQRSPLQSLFILVLTIMLFGAARFVQKSTENLVCLVAVLLIHEAGHFAGMKLFGYKDVRMFFLPFFGAAVSGRSLNVAGWKVAVVILLGPLPGIAIGLVLGLAAMLLHNESLRPIALLFTALNGFNLLPFMPMDGGRLLQLVLFGRQRHLEALFQAITGILLALIGFAGGGWILGVVGLLMLVGSGHVFRIRTLAGQISEELGDDWKAAGEFERVPKPIARQILEGVRGRFPQIKSAKVAAGIIRQVWDRMLVNLPGAAATVAILGVYAVSFVGVLVASALLVLAGMKH